MRQSSLERLPFLADHYFSSGNVVQLDAPGGWYGIASVGGYLSPTKITGISVLIFENSGMWCVARGMRGDPEATLPAANTLLALSRQSGLALYIICGEAIQGWARA